MIVDSEPGFRRLVYRSVPTARNASADLLDILAQSRRNNGVNGVSGLLVAGEGRYVQVLEGTPEAVEFVLDLIRSDDRHTAFEILQDSSGQKRIFGDWAMANLPIASDDAVRRRLGRMLRDAPDPVRQAFAGVA